MRPWRPATLPAGTRNRVSRILLPSRPIAGPAANPSNMPAMERVKASSHARLSRMLVTATLLLAAVGAVPARAQTATDGADDVAFFETQVRPLLASRCQACHGEEKQFAGLRTDSRKSLLAGGKGGPAVIPGNAADSLLMRAVRGESLRMPLDGALDEGEVAALAAWIDRGAPWPAPAAAALAGEDRYAQLAKEHWAFQPISDPAPPAAPAEHPIDRFIQARLLAEGLSAAPPAGPEALARRLHYLLTGLPPSADALRELADDRSADAVERLADRLLASPHYGERWARHWLDLVRFAETRGYEWNYEIVGAWRYRDYIVRAFNDDVPYDQLVREHIAGDLLESPRVNEREGIHESAIGTAFYRLGEAGHDDCVKFRGIALDVVDNQIDVLSKTFQGLTVACARCHDHKLDPIPTTDYYGLYGILNSSRVTTHTIDAPAAGRGARRAGRGEAVDSPGAEPAVGARSGGSRPEAARRRRPSQRHARALGRPWPTDRRGLPLGGRRLGLRGGVRGDG